MSEIQTGLQSYENWELRPLVEAYSVDLEGTKRREDALAIKPIDGGYDVSISIFDFNIYMPQDSPADRLFANSFRIDPVNTQNAGVAFIQTKGFEENKTVPSITMHFTLSNRGEVTNLRFELTQTRILHTDSFETASQAFEHDTSEKAADIQRKEFLFNAIKVAALLPQSQRILQLGHSDSSKNINDPLNQIAKNPALLLSDLQGKGVNFNNVIMKILVFLNDSTARYLINNNRPALFSVEIPFDSAYLQLASLEKENIVFTGNKATINWATSEYNPQIVDNISRYEANISRPLSKYWALENQRALIAAIRDTPVTDETIINLQHEAAHINSFIRSSILQTSKELLEPTKRYINTESIRQSASASLSTILRTIHANHDALENDQKVLTMYVEKFFNHKISIEQILEVLFDSPNPTEAFQELQYLILSKLPNHLDLLNEIFQGKIRTKYAWNEPKIIRITEGKENGVYATLTLPDNSILQTKIFQQTTSDQSNPLVYLDLLLQIYNRQYKEINKYQVACGRKRGQVTKRPI